MDEMVTVLLVEDDENILRTNRRILEREGYTVLCARTLKAARELLVWNTPDALVLDIMLPDGNGLAFCEEIRPALSAPVLFLTALDEKSEIIEGLVAGGNDYITKPYDVDEFLARINAQLRFVWMNQWNAGRHGRLIRDTLMLDLTAQRAYLDGKDMLLTQKEYSLLLLLARSEGKTLSSEYLYRSVWNLPMNDNRTLKKHISTVRKKLEEGKCKYTIASVYGKGYTFERT